MVVKINAKTRFFGYEGCAAPRGHSQVFQDSSIGSLMGSGSVQTEETILARPGARLLNFIRGFVKINSYFALALANPSWDPDLRLQCTRE